MELKFFQQNFSIAHKVEQLNTHALEKQSAELSQHLAIPEEPQLSTQHTSLKPQPIKSLKHEKPQAINDDIIKKTHLAFKYLDATLINCKAAMANRKKINPKTYQEYVAYRDTESLTLDRAQEKYKALVKQMAPATSAHPDLNKLETILFQQTPQNKTPLYRKLLPATGGFRDPATGLYAELHKDPASNQYVLCFAGTNRGAMLRAQLKANLHQFLGVAGVPEIYRQAAELTKAVNDVLKKENPPGVLQTAGHSLGGGLASYTALKNDLSGITYNAAALGQACIQDLHKDQKLKGTTYKGALKPAIAEITNFRTHDDVVSDKQVQKTLYYMARTFMPFLKRGVPKSVGDTYVYERGNQNIKNLPKSGHLFKNFYPVYGREIPDRKK